MFIFIADSSGEISILNCPPFQSDKDKDKDKDICREIDTLEVGGSSSTTFMTYRIASDFFLRVLIGNVFVSKYMCVVVDMYRCDVTYTWVCGHI